MLEELKNIDYSGGRDGLLFFIREVIGDFVIRIKDAEILCSHAMGKNNYSAGELYSYCRAFDWIKEEDGNIFVSPTLIPYLHDKEKLNKELISSTVNQLFVDGIFNLSMFSYDSVQCCYAFKNELLPLSLSDVRNVLISQGFLISLRDSQGVHFFINSDYDDLIAKHCKEQHKQISIEKLKKMLKDNELAGEEAELFVLFFEKARIGQPLCEKIKRISEIDTSAGYDIVSFNSPQSISPNRFIEVKAVSSNGFFWSKNEYEIAKLKGEMYYIYLVDLSKINNPEYTPEIIQDPATIIMEDDSWFVEAQSYHIKRV